MDESAGWSDGKELGKEGWKQGRNCISHTGIDRRRKGDKTEDRGTMMTCGEVFL